MSEENFLKLFKNRDITSFSFNPILIHFGLIENDHSCGIIILDEKIQYWMPTVMEETKLSKKILYLLISKIASRLSDKTEHITEKLFEELSNLLIICLSS